jgi:tetratricopeptide (TPR) repeat protein
MRRGAAITVGALAALLVSCAVSVPPVPDVPLAGLDADVRDAIQKARDEAVAQPRSGQASGHFGMVLEAHALYEPAALAFQRAIRLDPKEFAWRYYLAVAQEFASRPEQALAAVSDALRIRPDYTPAVLKRGALLLKLGRFQESDAVLEPLIAQNIAENPASAETLYYLARVKFAQGDFTAAEDLYRRACEAYPMYGAAWFGLAEAGRRLGHNAESEKNFRLAESYKDHNPPATDPLLADMLKLATGIETRLAQAKRLMDRKKFDEASRLYKEVLKQFPDNPDCLVNLLYMAQFPNQASPEEVEALYASARRIDPQLPLVYVYHGTALAAQGKYDAAVAELDKAIRLKPNNAEVHAWLADVRERQHRPADAIEQYRIAIAEQPDFRIARMALAKILLDAARGREAIPILLPVLQVEDENTPVAMMFLVQAYVDTGDRASARKYLEQAHEYVLHKGPSSLLPQIESGLRSLGSG